MSLSFKDILQGVVSWLGVLWIMISPWVIIISSILSTINWYSASASVVQGIIGFLVGGGLAALVMGVGFMVLVVALYFLE